MINIPEQIKGSDLRVLFTQINDQMNFMHQRIKYLENKSEYLEEELRRLTEKEFNMNDYDY